MKKLLVVFFVCFFLLLALAFTGSTAVAAGKDGPSKGKYETVRKTIYAPRDRHTYGNTYDRGYRNRSWYGRTAVPAGYWVYSYPYWYVYANTSPAYDRNNSRNNDWNNDRNNDRNNNRNNNHRNSYHDRNYDERRGFSWTW